MSTSQPESNSHESSKVELTDIAARAEQDIAEAIEKHIPTTPVEPKEFARTLAKLVSVEIREVAYSFQGPLPPASMMGEYNTVLPGLADRIAIRAEKEQAFRHEQMREETKFISRQQTIDAAKTFTGQVLAFIIAMTAIGGGIWLLAFDKSTAGLVAIIGALVALVAVFITGQVVELLKSKSKQSENTAGSSE